MWQKLPLLLGWLVIVVALNFALMAAMQWVRARLSGLLGFLVLELLIVALMATPFFNIWFLTGEMFGEAMLIIVIGTRITSLLAAGLIRLIAGADLQQRSVKEGMLLGALEPAAQTFFQRISLVLNAYGLLLIVVFSAAYLLLEGRAAATMMLTFILWSNPVVMLLFGGLTNVVLLSMPHLNEDTRARTFVDASVGLAPMFMAVVLTLYILYPGSIFAVGFSILGYGVPLYLGIAAAAFATFVALVVAPYALGVRKGKSQRMRLYLKQKRSSADLADALLGAYWTIDTAILKKALQVLVRQNASLEKQHGVIAKSITLLEHLADPEQGAASPIAYADIETFRRLDPRIRLHTFFQQNINNLRFAIETLERKGEALMQRQVLDHLVLENLRALSGAADELVKVERTKPAVFGAIASTFAIVGSLVLSLFGKVLFELIGRTVAFIL